MIRGGDNAVESRLSVRSLQSRNWLLTLLNYLLILPQKRRCAMELIDVFTAESIVAFDRYSADALAPGLRLIRQDQIDYTAEYQISETLQQWIAALQDADPDAAANPTLWAHLCEEGYVIAPTERTPYPDKAIFLFRIISPRIFDVFRKDGEPNANYAFTTVKVCLRRNREALGRIIVPDGWSDVALVDTELYEFSPGVTSDLFDDREKIHLVYLAGEKGGVFVYQPVYIGIGNNEAYGVGSRRRTTPGRFRFYRYDVKDNFHLEFVRATVGNPYTVANPQTLPDVTAIDENRATLLLGRGLADRGFLCLSDPFMARRFPLWAAGQPDIRRVFQEVTLEKVHRDLRREQPETPFVPDVPTVLNEAFRVHRWFFAAWQHPFRLSDSEGIDLYYNGLPAFRRDEYETYRFRPELLRLSPEDSEVANLTIPQLLRSDDLRARLMASRPGAVEELDSWLQREVVEDMYAYGNHPELRLCTAIALLRRLSDSGLWVSSVEAAYRSQLYTIDMSAACISVLGADGSA
jgi:hypothetical protein